MKATEAVADTLTTIGNILKIIEIQNNQITALQKRVEELENKSGKVYQTKFRYPALSDELVREFGDAV